MILRFTVPGRAISKNEGERWDRKYGHKIIMPVAREFMARVRTAARAAAAVDGAWIADPFLVKHCVVSITKWNMDCDHDAGSVYISDCLQYQRKPNEPKEPWGIYGNDRNVSSGPCPKPQYDGGPARTEITIELLETFTEAQAQIEREKWEIKEEKRQARKRAKRAKKAGIPPDTHVARKKSRAPRQEALALGLPIG